MVVGAHGREGAGRRFATNWQRRHTLGERCNNKCPSHRFHTTRPANRFMRACALRLRARTSVRAPLLSDSPPSFPPPWPVWPAPRSLILREVTFSGPRPDSLTGAYYNAWAGQLGRASYSLVPCSSVALISLCLLLNRVGACFCLLLGATPV